jgi:hypothetical protein
MTEKKLRSMRGFSIGAILSGVAMMASGCVAWDRVPSEALVSGLQSIAVVAVESPPFLVHPKTEADRNAVAAAGLTSPDSPDALWVLAYVASPAATFAISSAPRAGETAVIVQGSPRWMPTTGLAKKAALALQKTSTREVSVVDGYAELPITDRSVDEWLENWMSAVRRWYNAEKSPLDCEQLGGSGVDAILEVGVGNYEYFNNELIMSVFVRIIDPSTKQVLGRARNSELVKGEDLPAMLQKKGQPMRRLIETTGAALLTQGLKDLGLIPR